MIDFFANEMETEQIGGLTVENRIDRVSIYGSIDITMNKAGFEQARLLAALLAAIIKKLEVL